ncbi:MULTISPECIES: glycerate kinase [Streptomyces]|uniref:glycerate kinase n=1 Tax=Streptomyces TaxID=1883 RepID=UPI0006B501A9|nr:glycerate kinase [Streptomyces sp. NRRL S-4]
MRVLIVPNCLRGSLTAPAVAEALARGVRAAHPSATLHVLPAADGGDGSLGHWLRHSASREVTVDVEGPLGGTVRATYALGADGTAFIEMAEASGLRHVPDARRDPLRATTRGTGRLIRHALHAGARTVVLGAGGSATLDMGAGALSALGVEFRAGDGRVLDAYPGALRDVVSADTRHADPLLRGARLRVLSDVHTPLRENVVRFGPQKGIAAEDVGAFSEMLGRLARAVRPDRPELLDLPWYGAGGGTPAGLSVFGAVAESGSDQLLELAGVPKLIADADFVITAEGRVDAGSLDGKLPLAVSRLAARHGVPCVVVTGSTLLAPGELPAGTRCLELPPDCAPDRPDTTVLALAAAGRAAIPPQTRSREVN